MLAFYQQFAAIGRGLLILFLAGSLVAIVGCNSGLAALISGLSDSGSPGDSDSPSAVSAFAVFDTKTAPAKIRFVVTDANSDDVELELLYQMSDGTTRSITALQGTSNPETYASTPDGATYEVLWDFTSELDFDPAGGFVDGVTVFGQIINDSNAPNAVIAGATAAVGIGLGNDAPTIDSIITPTEEVAGVVPITLTVSDSSSDLVSIRVEYDVDNSGAWNLARPAAMATTPALAIMSVGATPGGTTLNFFWDANEDLPSQEHRIRLRLTPTDGVQEGSQTISQEFGIDNNAQTIAILDNGLVTTGALDVVGGIAIPFTLVDPESDRIRAVFQWRLPGQDFPALPLDDPAAVFSIQGDPKLREEFQVCSLRDSWVYGRPEAISATEIRLPELGTSEVPISTPDLVERKLELLRPSELPISLPGTWLTNPLLSPVAAVPVGDGLRALLLDQPTIGSWRVQVVELATGTSHSTLATGSGQPTAIALSPTGESFFTSAFNGSSFTIEQRSTSSGALVGTSTDSTTGADGIRGLAALSEGSVLATTGNALLRVSFASTPALVTTIVSGLATPWGVAVDPLDRRTALVAENTANRVVAVDLARATVSDALLPDPGPTPINTVTFPSPKGIALDRSGVRLLVTTHPGSGTCELRAMNRRSPHDLDASGFANPFAYVLSELPLATGAQIAAGHEGARLIVDPTTSDLIVIGGIEQRRTITTAPPSTNIVTVDEPLAPLLSGPRRWRVNRSTYHFSSSPTGAQNAFAWDSSDNPRGGNVNLRVIPFDTEAGVPSETTAERPTSSAIGHRRVVLDGLSLDPIQDFTDSLDFIAPVVVDFDRDGDLDVFISNGSEPRVVLQTAPGQFSSPQRLDLPLGNSLRTATHVTDIDADGDIDLIHLRRDQRVEILRGTGPLTFEPQAEILPTTLLTESVQSQVLGSLETADVNGDGRTDLIATQPARQLVQLNNQSALTGLQHVVLIYLQGSEGDFQIQPQHFGNDTLTRGTRDVATGDINGDGLMDLLVANAGDSTLNSRGRISVHLQAAGVDFDGNVIEIGEPSAFAPNIPDTAAVTCVELADLDGDGDLDILAGHGHFSIGQGPAVAPTYAGAITIYWQLEPGVFDATAPLILRGSELNTEGVQHLEVADMDGDGQVDVIAQGSKGVHIFRQTSPGSFADPQTFPYVGATIVSTRNTDAADELSVADIEGDGDLDIVYRNRTNNEIVALLQTSRGIELFPESATLIHTPGVTDGFNDVVVADMDSDGDMDMATSHGGFIGLGAAGTFQITFQSAPRTFVSTPLEFGDPILLTGVPVRVDAADLDQDGDNELIGVSARTNNINIWFQEEPGVFGSRLELQGADNMSANPLINIIDKLLVEDYDRDGVLELVTAHDRNLTVLGFDSNAPGQYAESFRYEVLDDQGAPLQAAPETIRLFDEDGDDNLDLVVGTIGFGTSGDFLYTFSGQASGPFDPTPVASPGAGASVIVDSDIDGDGDVDLLTLSVGVGFGGTPIQVRERTTSGSFLKFEIPGTSAVPGVLVGEQTRIVPHDIDADGDLDVLYLSPPPPTVNAVGHGGVSVVRQLGPGIFGAPELLVPGDVAVGNSLRLADLDGDGEVDILLPRALQLVDTGLRILWGNE
ncbi:MAG: FG-GAP-like repeat-containing protein [Planctomycetota bacterium]